MASYSKRLYKSWRVSAGLQSDLGKAFEALDQAQAYAQQLDAAGHSHAQIRPYQSTGWQARIRRKLAPQLTRTPLRKHLPKNGPRPVKAKSSKGNSSTTGKPIGSPLAIFCVVMRPSISAIWACTTPAAPASPKCAAIRSRSSGCLLCRPATLPGTATSVSKADSSSPSRAAKSRASGRPSRGRVSSASLRS